MVSQVVQSGNRQLLASKVGRKGCWRPRVQLPGTDRQRVHKYATPSGSMCMLHGQDRCAIVVCALEVGLAGEPLFLRLSFFPVVGTLDSTWRLSVAVKLGTPGSCDSVESATVRGNSEDIYNTNGFIECSQRAPVPVFSALPLSPVNCRSRLFGAR